MCGFEHMWEKGRDGMRQKEETNKKSQRKSVNIGVHVFVSV